MPTREDIAAVVTGEVRERAFRYLVVCESCPLQQSCQPPLGWFFLSHFPCGRMWDALRTLPPRRNG